MRRIAVGFLIAVMAVATMIGVAAAADGGAPSAQDAPAAAKHGRMGVTLGNINSKVKEQFNLTVDSGAVVLDVVPDGPAAKAGLKAGDVLLAIGETEVKNVGQATAAIAKLASGATVAVTVLRGNATLALNVTLAERPKPPAQPEPKPGILDLPSYIKDLPGNLIHAEFQVLDKDGKVNTIGVTYGNVQAITDTIFAIVRRDDTLVTFQTTADTKVYVGGRLINLSGLKKDTPVLVVEKNGAVTAVVAWPGDLLKRSKPEPQGKGKRQSLPAGPELRQVPLSASELPMLRGDKSEKGDKGEKLRKQLTSEAHQPIRKAHEGRQKPSAPEATGTQISGQTL